MTGVSAATRGDTATKSASRNPPPPSGHAPCGPGKCSTGWRSGAHASWCSVCLLRALRENSRPSSGRSLGRPDTSEVTPQAFSAMRFPNRLMSPLSWPQTRGALLRHFCFFYLMKIYFILSF